MLNATWTRSPKTARPTLSVQEFFTSPFTGTGVDQDSPRSSERCTTVSLPNRYATKTEPAALIATWRSIWYVDAGQRGRGAPKVRPPSCETWMIAAVLPHSSHPGTPPKCAQATYTFPRPSAPSSGSQSSPAVQPIRYGVENRSAAADAVDVNSRTAASTSAPETKTLLPMRNPLVLPGTPLGAIKGSPGLTMFPRMIPRRTLPRGPSANSASPAAARRPPRPAPSFQPRPRTEPRRKSRDVDAG